MFNTNLEIFKSFEEYLNNEILDSESREKILKKGEEIVKSFENMEYKRVLMVGHVQSGKTLNFISVIANALKNDYRVVIVLTAIDKKLHNQTSKRIKEVLNKERNSNYLKIWDTLEDIQNTSKCIKDIEQFVETSHSLIIPLLKNGKHIQNVINIFKTSLNFKNIKVLIIDDESDLASGSHKLTKNETKDSKIYSQIEKLLNITNSSYIAVTATPYVHLLTSKEKSLFLQRVFCIEPGKDYKGLKTFVDNYQKHFIIMNNFQLKKEIKWYQEDIFKEAIVYYLLLVTKKYLNNSFSPQTHSNMLVHTDILTSKHEEYANNIKNFIDSLKESLSKINDISYSDTKTYIDKIVKEYSLDFSINDKTIREFLQVLKAIRVYIINEKSPQNEINSNLAEILIGSNMLQRGITLDNLLVTFFTNRSKNNTAIDTLLQRARWFGYRKDILEDIKIFTTEEILKDFQEINRQNYEMWEVLNIADKNKQSLEDIEILIRIAKKNLIPTSKVPLKKDKTERKIYPSFIDNLIENKKKFEKIVKTLEFSKDKIILSDKYFYKRIKYIDKNEFLKDIDPILSTLNWLISRETIKNEIIDKLENKSLEIQVVFMDNIDNRGEARERKCSITDKGFKKIMQIFQGSNGKKGDKNYYPGDSNWHEISAFENTIFIQIHKIKPIFDKDNPNQDIDYIYVPAIIFPKDLDTNTFKPKSIE